MKLQWAKVSLCPFFLGKNIDFGVDEQTVYFGSECRSSECSRGRSVAVVNVHGVVVSQ
jgi:hypothetical protein